MEDYPVEEIVTKYRNTVTDKKIIMINCCSKHEHKTQTFAGGDSSQLLCNQSRICRKLGWMVNGQDRVAMLEDLLGVHDDAAAVSLVEEMLWKFKRKWKMDITVYRATNDLLGMIVLMINSHYDIEFKTLYFFLGVWDFFARCCKRGHEPVDN